MTRKEIHTQFAAQFHAEPRAVQVTPAEMESLDQSLATRLPLAYQSFLLQQGPMVTPTISGLAQENRDVWPLLEICPPSVVLAATRSAWKSGLPRSLIVIAKGPGGTLFCLERTPGEWRRADDGAVWGFDPITGSPVRMTDSFDVWLHEYVTAVYEDEEFRCGMDEVADQAAGKRLRKRAKP